MRRHGVRVAVASARPTALDPRADAVLRTAPSGGAALLVALDAALAGDVGDLGGAASAAGTSADAVSAFAEALTAAGEDVVIVYGERLLSGAAGEVAARALLNLASRLGLAGREGAGLLEIPAAANGRGLREAGFAAGHGPGYATLAEPGGGAGGIAQGLADGDLHTLYLLHADPLRTHPDRALWEQALHTAQAVIAHESVLTETVREYATVVFPAEAYAEKEGTLVHPDGRLQRLRAAIGRAKGARPGGGVRAGWQVIADVAARAGHDLGVAAGPMASRQLFDAVPFYAGPDARRDRRPRRALAGARVRRALRGRAVGAGRAEDPGGRARAARREGRAAPRHLPLALELQGGRRLAGAAVPAPAAGRRALAAPTPSASASREGDRVEVGSPPTARACAARCACATRCRAARCSSPRARPTSPPTRSPTRSWRSTASAARRSQRAPSRSRSRPRSRGLAEARPSAPLEIPPTGPGQSGHGA